MNLALSTSWNSFRQQTASALINEIKGLGFDAVELNFSLTKALVDGVGQLVKQNQISVTSVHNFCPIPEGLSVEKALPDCFSLASLDEKIRKLAVKYTKISIDTAKRLQAAALVLHAGRVEVEDRSKELFRLYNLRKTKSPEYKNLISQIKRERQEKAKPHFQQALKSLSELSNYAQAQGISVGVETRFYFREIPSFPEIGIILNEFSGKNIYYWHDTGHAQVYENLGLGKHEDYLKTYGDKMLGIHLHDVCGTSDHRAPSKGDIDFNCLKKYIKKDTLRVIEAHRPASPEDIQAAKAYLEDIFKGSL